MDPREVIARLDTPQVRTLLAFGYTGVEMTAAIKEQLQTQG